MKVPFGTQPLHELTTRDVMAMSADIPWEVSANLVKRIKGRDGTSSEIIKHRAVLQYMQADAMLVARYVEK